MKHMLSSCAAALLLCIGAGNALSQALNFGAYSYLTIGNVLSDNHSYTKEAWVRIYPTGAVHGRNIISSFDAPFWLENGVLSAANNYGTTHVSTIHDPAAFTLSVWTHVAVTYDAATSTMTLYKNGLVVASTTSAPAYTHSTMQIGAVESGDFLDGTDVDEARVWGVALSGAQIAANMSCDVTGQPGLLAYYKFNEGTPGGNNTALPYATDYTGNGFNGTFFNFALTGSSNNYITGQSINAFSAITGSSTACTGKTITLSDATAGGNWSSSNTSLATVSSAGVVTGVAGGSPNITYTSTNGCIAIKGITVNSAPAVTLTPTAATCNGSSDGSVSTSVSGGSGSYTYSWSNGPTTSGISGVPAATYTLTVTDANTCAASQTAIVTQPAPLTNTITVTPANTTFTGGVSTNIYFGYGPQSATITSNASGSGNSFSWSPSTHLSNTAISNPVFTPASAGQFTYTCTVTASSGCKSAATVSFCVVDAQDHSHSGKVLVCHNDSNSLSISSNAVDAHLRNHNDYLGTCGAGCSARVAAGSHTVIEEEGMTVTAYPNPFGDQLHLKIETEYAEKTSVALYDLMGRLLFSKQDADTDHEITISENLPAGMYLLQVKQGDHMHMAKVVKN